MRGLRLAEVHSHLPLGRGKGSVRFLGLQVPVGAPLSSLLYVLSKQPSRLQQGFPTSASRLHHHRNLTATA
jgi:hypothetical protein